LFHARARTAPARSRNQNNAAEQSGRGPMTVFNLASPLALSHKLCRTYERTIHSSPFSRTTIAVVAGSLTRKSRACAPKFRRGHYGPQEPKISLFRPGGTRVAGACDFHERRGRPTSQAGAGQTATSKRYRLAKEVSA